jgi:hypothetical protein
MNRGTGFHGLPAEYRTPPDEVEEWSTTVAYLQALEGCGRPIVIAVRDPRQSEPGFRLWLNEQIGFLRLMPTDERAPNQLWLALNWPDMDQPCGRYAIDQRLFEGATLHTTDGDDYFGLAVHLGPVTITVMDNNINLEHASEEWRRRYHQTYLDLPRAREIEEKWESEPDRDTVRSMKEDVARWRHALVERGATAAEEMSDAELEAAANRVSWRLRTSGRMAHVPHERWLDLFLEEFASNLRQQPE